MRPSRHRLRRRRAEFDGSTKRHENGLSSLCGLPSGSESDDQRAGPDLVDSRTDHGVISLSIKQAKSFRAISIAEYDRVARRQ